MTDVQKSRFFAALSYISILFIIPWMRKQDDLCQFHAKQGLVVFIVWVILSIVAWVPVFGQIAVLVMFIVNVIAIVKTLNGEKWEIPYLSLYAKKMKF